MRSGTADDAERPATFRDVLAVREFRSIYASSSLSWVGDYLARAAIAALVYDLTKSVAASAAAFAVSFAPWLLGGPVLASVAERYPYRTVMVICDLARAAIMAALGWLALPIPAMIALLLVSALFGPPFEAARSATLPLVLPGDRYVVGLALHTSTALPAQVLGYVIGGTLAGGTSPKSALLVNALTFAVSAALLTIGTKHREPALPRSGRTHLLRETADGFRLVFTTPALRALVLLVFATALFVVVPEGLGAAWAADLSAGEGDRGLAQSLIMAAVPLGSLLGALSVTRLVRPATRRTLLRPLAVAAPLALVPSLFSPPLAVVTLLAGLAGFALGAASPIANGLFVQALPNAFRARAFGVVQGGLQLLQGGAVLVTGLLAEDHTRIPLVVGVWSLFGVVLLVGLSLAWPTSRAFTDAVAAATAANAPATNAAATNAPVANAPSASAPAGPAGADRPPARADGHARGGPETVAPPPTPRRAGAPVGRHRL